MPNPILPRRSFTPLAVPSVSTDISAPGELVINWADKVAYSKDASGNLITVPLGGSGCGGSGSIVEYATEAAFPATGAATTLYIATDVSRAYRWTGSVYVEVGVDGGGSGAATEDPRWDLLKPAAPTSVTATGGNAQAVVTWTAPTVLSVTPVTDYVVQYSSNSGSTWTTFSDGTSTATTATVTGLTNGTAYTFRVAATNGVGTGAYSTASSAVTPGDVYRSIPAMTSNTSPSGQVSGQLNNGSSLWLVVDGVAGTFVNMTRADYNEPKRFIQYAFPEGQKSRISGYEMVIPNTNYGSIPSSWNFYGSDDLSNWTLLDSRYDASASQYSWFGASYTAGDSRQFTLAAVANYRSYKWVFYESHDGTDGPALATLQLVA